MNPPTVTAVSLAKTLEWAAEAILAAPEHRPSDGTIALVCAVAAEAWRAEHEGAGTR